MEEVYQTLNYYLNEICKYTFYEYLKHLDLEHEVGTNHLTYDEVFMLAREIVEQIDPNYLEEYDKLITTGKLDFDYEARSDDSECIVFFENKQVKNKIINIKRKFNYEDVISIIHEFMHYTNGDTNNSNRYYLTEFISIYFECYAVQYLLDKGIPSNEIDYFKRLIWTKEDCLRLYQYEIALLVYIDFGDINNDTINYLQKYIMNISKEDFLHECCKLNDWLNNIYEDNEEEIEQEPSNLGTILSEEFVTKDYRYILGTILAIYALKFSNFKDMVYLNNHIAEYDDKSIFDILLSIGINLKDENFLDDLKLALDDFVNNKTNNKNS